MCFKIHRLVAEAFIENQENKPYVNHIDGCKTNNSVSNLEWCTPKENTRHAIDTGLFDVKKLTLSNKKRSKLKLPDIAHIRCNFKKNDRSFGSRALARKFGVSHSTVLKAVSV